MRFLATRRTTVLVAACAALAGTAVAPAPVGAAAPPTTKPAVTAPPPVPSAVTNVADLQRVFDAGNYTGAVSAASRLAYTSGAAAAGIDKSQVYSIKGEAQLRLKQYPLAADAFAKAAKAAPDVHAAAVATATELLVRRSRAGLYTPKQPPAAGEPKPAPVGVTDAGRRTEALGYLFDDEFAAAGSKLRAAKTATTVPQLLTAADTAGQLRLLELAATGADEKTRPELDAIAGHAHNLLSTNLQSMAGRVSDIRQAANTQTVTYQRVSAPTSASGYYNKQVVRKAGLTDRNVSELKDIASTCRKIVPAAESFAKATAAGSATAAPSGTGGSGVWDALSAQATRVAAQAQDVLSADYSNGYTP